LICICAFKVTFEGNFIQPRPPFSSSHSSPLHRTTHICHCSCIVSTNLDNIVVSHFSHKCADLFSNVLNILMLSNCINSTKKEVSAYTSLDYVQQRATLNIVPSIGTKCNAIFLKRISQLSSYFSFHLFFFSFNKLVRTAL
jgi:hypothetical protein